MQNVKRDCPKFIYTVSCIGRKFVSCPKLLLFLICRHFCEKFCQ